MRKKNVKHFGVQPFVYETRRLREDSKYTWKLEKLETILDFMNKIYLPEQSLHKNNFLYRGLYMSGIII